MRKLSKSDRLGWFTEPLICGVDEAGRGPLAGPVVAAAVVLPHDFDLAGIKDSKALSPTQRDYQRERIENSGARWSIGVVGHDSIDDINILNASLMAMKLAVTGLGIEPDLVMVDGNRTIPELDCRQEAVVGGDRDVPAIAAASILAKTYRDDIMRDLDGQYPGYGFGKHKGYPTREHIACLERLGPSPIHRRTFHPVSAMLKEGMVGKRDN